MRRAHLFTVAWAAAAPFALLGWWAIGAGVAIAADPSLPPGDVPPPPPTELRARYTEQKCADAAAAQPACVLADLSWQDAAGSDAVYRIYETQVGAGEGASCGTVDGVLVTTTPVNAGTALVGPLEPVTGITHRCLFIAAANAAGESQRVLFPGDLLDAVSPTAPPTDTDGPATPVPGPSLPIVLCLFALGVVAALFRPLQRPR